ncbi:MAG: acyl carrier protein [Tumebacillaceae bacterium]
MPNTAANQSQQALHQQVVDILAVVSNRAPQDVAPDAKLIDDLGIDSIQFLELFAMLEEQFGFELGLDDLRPELLATVSTVVEFVQERMAA